MPRHKRGWAIEETTQHHKRRTPLTVALIEPAILILLQEKALHGYALKDALFRLGIYPVHPSVVYRTLKQMELLEWVVFTWDTDAGQGPPRKIFSLTEMGEKALEVWKNELEKSRNSIEQLLCLAG
jgi:PadR family transcriptional regulator PadR